MNRKYAIGADVGGSHISTVLVDLQRKQIIENSHSEQKVDNKASAHEILNSWATAIKETMQHSKNDEVAGIGFAMPGPFDYKNGVALMDKSVAKYENLFGRNVGDELKELLDLPQSMPFRYLNDALAFAVGECWIGKAANYENVMAITLGTGFGSAFLTNGVPVIEGDRVPEKGYVYHIPYESGIADDYFSTRWFITEFEKRTRIVCNGVKEIADKASETAEARKLFEDFGTNIGEFLAPLLSTFDADCLVIGGNISGAYPLFAQSFEAALSGNNLSVEVVISELMESAAMTGSARLLEESFWNKLEPLVSKI
ncbi:ROK family protein [Tangfeifania diversioriginum]|nr:ROK family protein [Tangfeifania diversioriginum]